MSAKVNSQKMISLALVIAVLAIGVAVFTYIQVAFGQSSGFTGPPGSPPTGTGLLTASGNNLGVNTATPSTTLTVGGILSVAGNLISDVATPAAGTDAANKDYVDAQSAGGGAAITMWGIGGTFQPALAWASPAGTLSSCIRGNREMCASLSVISPISPENTAPSCPTGYASAYAGYGPHALYTAQYYYPTNYAEDSRWSSYPSPTGPGPEPEEYSQWHYAFNPVALSYSICSTSKSEVVQYSFTSYAPGTIADSTGNGISGGSVAVASACAPGPGGAGASEVCNVCRVCVPE